MRNQDKHKLMNPGIEHMSLSSDPAPEAQQMLLILRGMADMLRITNDRIGQLEHEVRLLKPVTPAQVNVLNAIIRGRAAALCTAYQVSGKERSVANAIRRELRLTHGVQNMRELPQVEYTVVKKQVELWDDYKTMKAIKAKG